MWQQAIDLGPRIMELADELPMTEQMGLSLQMRQIMVELPTAVAADLVNGTKTRQTAGLRLLATLELVDHVYPALDTGKLRTSVDALVERLLEDATPAPAPAHAAAAALPAPKPTPADVAVVPEPETTARSMPTIVPITGTANSEESHVHADSGQ
jgi:hypothetical protein